LIVFSLLSLVIARSTVLDIIVSTVSYVLCSLLVRELVHFLLNLVNLHRAVLLLSNIDQLLLCSIDLCKLRPMCHTSQ
jgi:hypothetical protein